MCYDISGDCVVVRTPVGERELSSLNAMRDVYGIRAVRFNQRINTVAVEYDASRLTKADIEFMLRNAGIRLRNELAGAA